MTVTVRMRPHVFHLLRLAAGGHQIPGAADVDRDDGNVLRPSAAPLGDGEGFAVADAGGHRDPVEDPDGEPRRLEVGHAERV